MDHRRMLGVGLCLIGLPFPAQGPRCSTVWVSPEGGNVPPYKTPETAARRISDAAEAAGWGDTILVAPGAYAGQDVRTRPGVTLQGNPPGARIQGLGSLWTAEWCQLKKLTLESVDLLAFREANVVVSRSNFSDVGAVWITERVAFVECSFSDTPLDLRGHWQEVPPRPVFVGCKMAHLSLQAGDSTFYGCRFVSTRGSAGSAVFIDCVAGRESGFSAPNEGDSAVFKHCTLGHLSFDYFLLVEDCIITASVHEVRPDALHNCILRSGDISEELLAVNNNRYGTPLFAGWVAYEETGVYVAPGGDPGGDGTEGEPLPLVSSGVYQTYDYHLVAGSPGIGEATDGGNIGAYPDAEPLPRGTDKVVVNIAPGRYFEYLEDFYGRGSIHLRKRGEGEVRIELPPGWSFSTDETDVLEGITFAGGRVEGRARIADCVFEGSAYWGLSCGGPQGAPSLISRSKFQGNARAGALVWRDHVAIFDNCVFTGNQWGLQAYGLAIATNCTISGNDSAISGNVDMTNSIVWGNRFLSDETPPAFVVNYSLIQGGYPGEGNIDRDPIFVHAERGDLRLSSGSPCIDRGNNSAPDLPETDIAGMHRIMFGGKSFTVDMGAYEFYINKVEPVPGADETIFTWSSLASKTYSIFYSSDLLNWHAAIDNFPSLGNMTTSWTDDGSLTGAPPSLVPRRFYRVLEDQ